MFVQVTLSPTLIVRVAGTNVKFWIVTANAAASALAAPPMKSTSAATKRRTARTIVDRCTPRTIRAMPVASAPFAALAREAARFGLEVTPEQIAVCERYADELTLRNTNVNLTAITEPADIAHKHFLDSWTAFGVRRWTGRGLVVDVGTGAVFPCLALRIAM